MLMAKSRRDHSTIFKDSSTGQEKPFFLRLQPFATISLWYIICAHSILSFILSLNSKGQMCKGRMFHAQRPNTIFVARPLGNSLEYVCKMVYVVDVVDDCILSTLHAVQKKIEKIWKGIGKGGFPCDSGASTFFPCQILSPHG